MTAPRHQPSPGCYTVKTALRRNECIFDIVQYYIDTVCTVLSADSFKSRFLSQKAFFMVLKTSFRMIQFETWITKSIIKFLIHSSQCSQFASQCVLN